MAGDRPHPPIVGSGTPRSTLVDTAIQAVQAAGDDPVTGFHSQHLRARDGPGFALSTTLAPIWSTTTRFRVASRARTTPPATDAERPLRTCALPDASRGSPVI